MTAREKGPGLPPTVWCFAYRLHGGDEGIICCASEREAYEDQADQHSTTATSEVAGYVLGDEAREKLVEAFIQQAYGGGSYCPCCNRNTQMPHTPGCAAEALEAHVAKGAKR